MKPTLVFSHANGFPAGSYRKLFDAWTHAGWRMLAPPQFGHDAAYPVVSNWRPTRDELIRFIEYTFHYGLSFKDMLFGALRHCHNCRIKP